MSVSSGRIPRGQHVVFTAPYCDIDATYLVRGKSTIASVDEVDQPGVRIASKRGAAYTLWLDRNITKAKVIHTDTIDESYGRFAAEDLEVLAGLRPRLLSDAKRSPGSRVLDGSFTAVHQAIGTPRARDTAGITYLEEFVTWAIRSSTVTSLIERYEVRGLSVPPPSSIEGPGGLSPRRPSA